MDLVSRAALSTAGALTIIAAVSGAQPGQATARRVTSPPPECVTVRIANPSGPLWWSRWCGSGAAGESPLLPGVAGRGPLLVDGAFIRPAGCGSFTRPCVIVWPASPQS